MASIPAAAVPAVRAALQSQGFPSRSVRDDGSVDPVALLSGVYDTVEFSANVLPTVRVKVVDLAGDGQPSLWGKVVQPAVKFTGGGGTFQLAPYGAASPWTGTLVFGASVLGLVYLGYLLGKKR